MTAKRSQPSGHVSIRADLKAELDTAAKERMVSTRLLVERACRDMLDHLVPVDELEKRW